MITGILWIIAASVIGFIISAVSADLLKLKRNFFLLLYVPSGAILVSFFIFRNNINIEEELTYNIYLGLSGALIVGLMVIRNVFSQPASPRNKGGAFLLDIMWPGLAYGLIDALLLSVLPVLALRVSIADNHWSDSLTGKIGFGALALLGSFFVTTVYHAGFPEFRGKKLIWANVGNGLLTLAYLVTLNPLAAILPHMAMHVTAMIHGRESTGQVPPHYHTVTQVS